MRYVIADIVEAPMGDPLAALRAQESVSDPLLQPNDMLAPMTVEEVAEYDRQYFAAQEEATMVFQDAMDFISKAVEAAGGNVNMFFIDEDGNLIAR